MKHDEFILWSQQRIDECANQHKALQADGRGDEAAFMQIRANVYGIFQTVCRVLQGDEAKMAVRLAQIPAAWEASLAQAQRHGDAQQAHIERIKLDTVAHIRAAWEASS